MGRKRHTPEQIIHKLRQAEVELSKGATVPQAAKKIGVTEQTYYRWRAEYGGMRVDQAKVLIARWRRHYNQVRPHSSLGYRPPAPEASLPRGQSLEPMPLYTRVH